MPTLKSTSNFDIATTLFDTVAPENALLTMLEHMDGNHFLWVPSFDPELGYNVFLKWNAESCKRTNQQFLKIYEELKEIAPYYEQLLAQPAEEILPEHLIDTWESFARPFPSKDERLPDLLEREAIGFDASEFTEEEKQALDLYYENCKKEAAERVGESDFCYILCNTTRRLCRLLSLGAPQAIIDNEAKDFAIALGMHKYGYISSKENKEHYDFFQAVDEMDEFEMDREFYPMKKTNSRKSLLPLFTYLIIKECSSFEKPLSQRDIMEELNNRYEIKVERKSLSRTIHSLEDENLGITSEKQRGVWYDRYD